MAREIIFQSPHLQFQASIIKVEREKIYGWTTTKTYDSKNAECKLVTLLDDGKTIVPSGGFSIKCITAGGAEVSRKDLIAVNKEGAKLALVPSVFDAPILLDDSKTMEDYLGMTVKSIYQLIGIADKKMVHAALSEGKVFHFIFNYRADYEGDDAFIVPGDEEVFVVVGKMNHFEMIGLDTMAMPSAEVEEEEEDLDFSML